MKKTLALVAASMLLAATPVLADTQPLDDGSGGLKMKMKGVSLDLGGFIEAAGIYRTRNLDSDLSTPFQKLPLPNQTGYYQDETRFSARQSRLSILAEGNAAPTIHLAGYYEMDFLGAAPTANSNESNSYNPRVRHLYATADWDSLGLHMLAGQTWSLVTMNSKGITPRNEVTPLTIDAQYVPGFTWTRQAQYRIVKDFDKTFWLALSIENPQTTSIGSGTNYALPGGNLAGGNFAGAVSNNSIPDIVIKASYDPSWGHFEVYDLIRVFKSSLIANGAATNDSVAANAVGGGMILPIMSDKLKLQVSGIYGKGIGRYGSGQLADATLDATGKLVPVTEGQLLTGLIFDPTKEWNFYGYYGIEEAQREPMGVAGRGYGSLQNNTSIGAPTGPGVPAAFQGQLQRVDQVTAGLWWKFFQGSFGRMQAGLQYSYTENKYFSGTVGAPKGTDQMVFTSLRYYWQ